MNVARLAAVGLLGYGFWLLYRQATDTVDEWYGLPVDDAGLGLIDQLQEILPTFMTWSTDKIPQQYRSAITAAEVRYNLPAGLLARQLYQESRYRPDIISGKVRSSAGAVGIAQFMPGTAAELGIDPLDPFQSIDGAGRYMAKLYAATGSWDKALASYNWGIGNVSRKGLEKAPTETRNYFTQILADLGIGGPTYG